MKLRQNLRYMQRMNNIFLAGNPRLSLMRGMSQIVCTLDQLRIRSWLIFFTAAIMDAMVTGSLSLSFMLISSSMMAAKCPGMVQLHTVRRFLQRIPFFLKVRAKQVQFLKNTKSHTHRIQ